MILTTHALIGAAIGKNISNLWLIPLITIPLHFLMDHFRHGDYLNKNSKVRETWWKIVLDFLVGSFIVFGIIHFQDTDSRTSLQIIVGMFSSMLPDFLTAINREINCFVLNKIHDFHVWCHKYASLSKKRIWSMRNAINDIVLSFLAIILLLFS